MKHILFCIVLITTLVTNSQNSLFLNGPINYVAIGDLDVTGNQLTIEALINYTSTSVNIVSKHTDPSNVNYLFRPGSFEITTTNGFAAFGGAAAAGVTLVVGETYHLAATYNGQFLRYYVNGCLTGEMPWTGNMVTNNLITAIGQQSSCQCEQFNGYIDEVRIWNVARTQAQIAQNMLDLPNPTTQAGLLAYYKFEGNFLNVQGNAAWNGVAVGTPQFQPIPYPYPTALGVNATSSPVVCENTATGVIDVAANGGYLPYTYSIDGVNFVPTPTFTNLTPGNYTVFARSNANCVATTPIIIDNNPALEADLSLTNVTCHGENQGSASINPNGGNGGLYRHEWFNGNTTDLSVNDLPAGNYSVTITDSCKTNGPELVTNGHFENGNTGFTSDYSYCSNCFSGNNDLGGGLYLVSHDANIHHAAFQGLGNGGQGNYMIINGAETANTNVWCQTINVTPNTYYIFSSWVTSVHPSSPAELQFSVNGSMLGPVFTAPNTINTWDQFAGTWYSGASTTATICIVNQNTDPAGNDFGLDDISFKACLSCEEVVNFTITEPNPLNLVIDITDERCDASDGQIDIAVSGGVPNYEYSIDNGNTFVTTSTFSNLQAGTYNVRVRDDNGCEEFQSIEVNSIGSSITVDAGNNQIICSGDAVTLTATANANVSWDNAVIDGTPFFPTGTAVYTVTATDAFGCSASDQVMVTVNPLPNVFAGPNQSICQGEDVVLEATGANSYQWDFNVVNGVPFSPTNTQTYTVIGIDGNNCSNSDEVTVNVNALPQVFAGTNQTVCEGTAVTLIATGATTYTWNNGVVNGVAFTPLNTQTYTVVGTDNNNCSSSDQVTIIVNPLPIVDAGFDQVVCENTLVTLTASGAQNYSWDSNVVNGQPFTPPTGQQTYTVVGEDLNGCVNSDQVSITVVATPNVNFSVGNAAGCLPIQVNFTNLTNAFSFASCEWNFGDGTSINDCNTLSHTYTSSGCFPVSLTVTTNEGCAGSFAIPNAVCIDGLPVADFITNPTEISTIDPRVYFINISQNATDYTWNFGDNSGLNFEESPSHEYEEAGSYLVTLVALNESGCLDTISKVVFIKDEILFYVPNSFTPDNNKFNDTFLPVFTSGFDPQRYNLLIYSRWGEVLFESNNAKVGWDGTYGGKIVPDGTYIWQIRFKSSQVDKPEIHRGHVNLIR